jgi:hypothetical protein
VALLIALVATACTGTTSSQNGEPETRASKTVTILNEGGTNEGHTPIGFAGTGTGLFIGDNLNPGFPDGDGVQTYMTFTLPDLADVNDAELRSDLLQTSGTPFDDLGELLAERVEYTTFGPDLFDLPASGDPTSCTVIDGSSVTCDVTTAVRSAIARGDSSVQIRLRFESVADNDGQPDLAMFYRTDSNTNERGLFTLVVDGS